MKKIAFKGIFNLVNFSFTHRTLLLRKTKITKSASYNTDILFVGSFYTEIPLKLSGLTIELGTLEDRDYLLTRCDEKAVHSIGLEEVYVIRSQNKKYYIGARAIEIDKNNYLPLE
jgi:hypothetical protein